MTTEDDFQSMLDLHPEDWQTRLIFADWLQERNDVRAEGWLAMGVMRKNPQYTNGDYKTWWYCVSSPGEQVNVLDGCWWHEWKCLVGYERVFGTIENRREVEDAAAIAFTKLSFKCRNKLLSSLTCVLT